MTPVPALIEFLRREFGWSLHDWEDGDVRF